MLDTRQVENHMLGKFIHELIYFAFSCRRIRFLVFCISVLTRLISDVILTQSH